MNNKYLKTKKYMILILLLISSLNCGANAVGYNFIEKINILLNNIFNTKYPIDKIIYFLFALTGILLVMNRDLWLECREDFGLAFALAFGQTSKMYNNYLSNQSAQAQFNAKQPKRPPPLPLPPPPPPPPLPLPPPPPLPDAKTQAKQAKRWRRWA